MQRQPLSVCAIVTPLPPGRPGSSRYQGASRVTLVSRKGWPLGRGLLAGVVSPLWLVFFRPAAACVRAPLMGLLSGRAPGLCWSAPPENSPPAKGVFDWSQNLNFAKFCGRRGWVRVRGLCACCRRPWLVSARLCLCASSLPPFSSPTHRPASGPSRPLCGFGGFCAPLI